MDSDDYEALKADVKTAARTTAREWDGIVEAEDAEQDIWVRLMESPGSVAKLVAMDKPGRVSALTAIGRQIGSGQRDDFEVFTGNYTYGTQDVRRLLETDVIAEWQADYNTGGANIWDYPKEVINQLSKTDRNTATERIDLALGLKSLSESNNWYLQVILSNYLQDDPVNEHRKDLTRAVDALTREMNRVHLRREYDYSGPGSRKVMPNAQAQKLTRNEYNK